MGWQEVKFLTEGEGVFYFPQGHIEQDNGRGMPHDDIPNMFGRVLSGTKYGLKQTRGKFGLGAKMALIWSKMSTGLPIDISSSMKAQNYSSFCKLDIDIHRYDLYKA
ncbi:DNA topoisomerase 6 subunit B-like [Camellia sinensis]|uniref:DNA topoisomerase 6 subunit B-like n=1 Tax=Camellia sinensis TaxID=4442 RepID=UPI001036EFF4|nr:DNA topoisomerase 6 subunit B-like [Camellia sinensis]